jgi:hypothetical protein
VVEASPVANEIKQAISAEIEIPKYGITFKIPVRTPKELRILYLEYLIKLM